jgi:mono/diheme cytochrome c family protein
MFRMTIGLAALLLAAGAANAAPSVERGEYLVRGPAGCGNCHSPMDANGFIDGMELAGRLVEDNDQFTAIAPNITPAARIAQWSDAELRRAIREGIRPDGSLIGPPMPFTMYRGLSDTDLDSIVAFLRTVKPVENEVPASQYRIALPPNYGPPVESVADIAAGVSVEYGAYLAGPVAHCMECHTPMGPQGPLLDTALGQGGFEFHGPWGVSVALNITSGEDGIGGYSDQEIIRMMREGVRPDGTRMLPPMPYPFLARMSDQDAAAIVAYLRSLPALPGN